MPDTLGFNVADLLALAAIVIGFIMGFRQGLSGQMTILLTGIGIWFCLSHGFGPSRDWLIMHTSLAPDHATLAARIGLTLLPILAGMLLYTVLRHLLKITFTTWVDRLGGALAGGMTATGIVLLVFILLNTLPPQQRPRVVGSQSWISREVIGSETVVVQSLIQRVEKGENLIEKARQSKAGKREKWEE